MKHVPALVPPKPVTLVTNYPCFAREQSLGPSIKLQHWIGVLNSALFYLTDSVCHITLVNYMTHVPALVHEP